MDPMLLFSVAGIFLIVCTLVCGVKGYYKTALACASAASLDLAILAVASARDPERLIEMFGYSVVNFCVEYIFVSAGASFVICSIVAIRWLWNWWRSLNNGHITSRLERRSSFEVIKGGRND